MSMEGPKGVDLNVGRPWEGKLHDVPLEETMKEARFDLCFANIFWEETEKIRNWAKDAALQHHLCGLNWEENRPKMLYKSDSMMEAYSIPKILPSRCNEGLRPYMTSIETAFSNAMFGALHVLESVSDFDAATPEDFRREIEKACAMIRRVDRDANEIWWRKQTARDIELRRVEPGKAGKYCQGCDEKCALYGMGWCETKKKEGQE